MSNSPSSTSAQKLDDIQGLRAVAVLLVLGFHLWPEIITGGYVGVDIFFVISGYLMTDIVLREQRKTGTLSIPNFFVRRIRRIVPSAALVIICVALTSPLLPPTSWQFLSQEVISSAFFVHNWLLALRAVDYLAQDDAHGVLQHYWSLGVEVQFYIFWPFFITAVFGLAKKSPFEIKHFVITFVSIVAIFSIYLSITQTAQNPARAYFATEVRVWEFMVGSLIAASGLRDQVSERITKYSQFLGAAAIALSAFWFTTLTPFPGSAALLPCIGAALIILGAKGTRITSILSAWPVTLIGDYSYAIYLWHWPLIVYWSSLSPDTFNFSAKIAIIIFSVILAAVSKVLVEDPLRRSGEMSRNQGNLILGFAISAFAMATSIIPLSLLINDYSTQSKMQGPVKQYPGARSLTEGAEFDSSLSFIPQIALAKHDRPVANLQGCQILHGTKPKTCEFGKQNGAKTLVSIGDSHAAVMSEALKIFAEKNDWTYIHMSKANCPFMDETVYNKDASKVEECEAWNNEALQLILELRPDFVLSAQSTKYLVSRSEARADSYELIVSGLERRWKTLQEYGIHVVPMRDFPTFKYNPVNCVAEGRADCDRPRSEVTLDREPATSAAIRVNTPVLDLTDGFCEADYCRAVVGNVFVWRDTAHPTATYMRTLAPYLEKKLKQIINRVDENKGIEEF